MNAPSLYEAANKHINILFLLAMSTLNSGEVQDLTQEKRILHHHAAMLKKDLDASYESLEPKRLDAFI